MGGCVSTQGQVAQVAPVRAGMRASTVTGKVGGFTVASVEAGVSEIPKDKHDFQCGETAHANNDFDVTDLGKIQQKNGVDYYFSLGGPVACTGPGDRCKMRSDGGSPPQQAPCTLTPDKESVIRDPHASRTTHEGNANLEAKAPKASEAPAEESQRATSLIRVPDEWWGEASLTNLGLPTTSRVMDSRIFHKPSRSRPPWSEGESESLYEEMGMRDPAKSYIAVWMLLGNAAILTVSEVVDPALFDHVLANGTQACLDRHLKLVIDPIDVVSTCRTMLPASATNPKEAEFVTRFLGKSGSHIHRTQTPNGVDHVCLMIDFSCAGRLIAWAMKKVAFREGHVLDLHVVNWSDKALFASGRLNITKEVTQML